MANLRPHRLTTAYHSAPLGLDSDDVRFSWQLQALSRGASQESWQVQVAPRGNFEKPCWDTGKIKGPEQLHINYAGESLEAHCRYQWRVRCWDSNDNVSDWSSPGDFSMGVLDQKEWKRAKWMRHFQENLRASPHLRREFKSDDVVDARLYCTARGFIHLELNGQDISDQRLLPGWTDYSLRLPSHCWDVTDHLKEGDNVLGCVLADGWYKGDITWARKAQVWGARIMALLMLRLEKSDGSVEWVCSDEKWRSFPGPILSACMLDGENYDANLELTGWSDTGYQPKQSWYEVGSQEVGDEKIERHAGSPVRAYHEFEPIEIWQPKEGRWIFNLGQNFAGHARLKIKVPAGTVIRLRFAEVLTPEREVYVDNLRTALATDIYTAKGGGEEVWEPKFTFHGFQYVEICGLPYEPSKETITGVVVGSDCPSVGQIRCSDPMIEKLASNAVWTQRANYIEVPTDCPQRDERLGWTGDAQAYIRTAIAFHDIGAFYTKWLQDLEDACTDDGRAPQVAPVGSKGNGTLLTGYAEAAWGDATTICPTWIHRCYGDRKILKKHYGMMTRYVDFYRRTCVTHRKVRYGLPSYAVDGKDVGHPTLFRDWLHVDSPTSHEIIRTAFYAYSTQLCSEAAKALGKDEEAQAFEKEWQEIRADFRREFLQPDGKIIGVTQQVESQTGYLLALHFDLLESDQRLTAVDHLIADIESHNWHLTTGFVGLPYLLPVLSRFGRTDVCYRLLMNRTYPSWGYEIEHGATSIWERWNGYHHEKGPGDPNMNSYSHYAYGAVCEWLFSDMAGIELLENSFSKIRIRPRTGGKLTHAGATYDSIRGPIRSDWRIEGNSFSLEVDVPGGVEAEIHLPTSEADSIQESDKALASNPSEEQGYQIVTVGSGSYRFTCSTSS